MLEYLLRDGRNVQLHCAPDGDGQDQIYRHAGVAETCGAQSSRGQENDSDDEQCRDADHDGRHS
ncbi:hypothetical protein [Nocardia sp. NPDC057272]|uniref:hypothetical protein n=1 Tax=Nocardia sp. NPDC057272 TaxID=3346079 RepID=UPI00363BB162